MILVQFSAFPFLQDELAFIESGWKEKERDEETNNFNMGQKEWGNEKAKILEKCSK